GRADRCPAQAAADRPGGVAAIGRLSAWRHTSPCDALLRVRGMRRIRLITVNRPLTRPRSAEGIPPSRAQPTLLLACCLATAPALAAKVDKVEIRGLADEAMEANVRSALSLNDELGKELRARRLGYLLRVAEDETRRALEPFGYYTPTITVI